MGATLQLHRARKSAGNATVFGGDGGQPIDPNERTNGSSIAAGKVQLSGGLGRLESIGTLCFR